MNYITHFDFYYTGNTVGRGFKTSGNTHYDYSSNAYHDSEEKCLADSHWMMDFFNTKGKTKSQILVSTSTFNDIDFNWKIKLRGFERVRVVDYEVLWDAEFDLHESRRINTVKPDRAEKVLIRVFDFDEAVTGVKGYQGDPDPKNKLESNIQFFKSEIKYEFFIFVNDSENNKGEVVYGYRSAMIGFSLGLKTMGNIPGGFNHQRKAENTEGVLQTDELETSFRMDQGDFSCGPFQNLVEMIKLWYKHGWQYTYISRRLAYYL